MNASINAVYAGTDVSKAHLDVDSDDSLRKRFGNLEKAAAKSPIVFTAYVRR